MSFIATGDAGPTETIITNDGFFPDLDPAKFRATMRLDGTVTTERLIEALIAAIQAANHDLAEWADQQKAAGHITLSAIPAPTINDVSIQVHRYTRAVYCLAHANLSERYRNFDATAAGHREADKLTDPIDDLRRDARWAIRDLLGQRRTTMELI